MVKQKTRCSINYYRKDYFRIKNLKIDEIKYVELKLQIQNKENS